MEIWVIEHGKTAKKLDLYKLIRNNEEKISLVGLGYVRLLVAVTVTGKADVIG